MASVGKSLPGSIGDFQSPFGEDALPTYSIKREFDDATVLVTGGSGYLGSLVLEQLLRTTNVKRIYVLIRGKRGCPAQERLQRLLHSGLFHMVRDNPKLLQKVQMLEGDLNSENLGLSTSDLEKAITEVEYVIHSAASIELEADVQHTLRSNYQGTRRLLTLAHAMQRLRCFLHVSTAYVNVNMPPGSSIEERIYPLKMGSQLINHAEIVEDLLSLSPDAANVRAQMYLDMWGFPNTYTLGKNITEQLVSSFYKSGLPVAIVRPTLVCGLAGAPYPGYCGNLAGPIGMGVAVAVGLFDCLGSVAMVPTHVWDAVPGDVVSSVILAAAAATAAQVAINEYKDSPIGSNEDPLIVHAGTSTTYPISFVEAAHAGIEFVRQNPPPFRLPFSALFTIPLDYRPDPQLVERCKYWTAWKVWFAVNLLESLGQYKTARRLKYGHMAWAIQNSSKTDRNLFFASKNLRRLEEQLDGVDAGHYTITWTIKNGGWQRYISTNIAGMYRLVFGISEVKGLQHNDFRFIPSRSFKPVRSGASSTRTAAAAATAVAAVDGAAAAGSGVHTSANGSSSPLSGQATGLHTVTEDAEGEESAGYKDVVEAGLIRTAGAFATIPASGARLPATESGGVVLPLRPRTPQPIKTGDFEGLSATRSENAGGLCGMISNRLGASLSYKAASVEEINSGTVEGGVMHTLLSSPVQRLGRIGSSKSLKKAE